MVGFIRNIFKFKKSEEVVEQPITPPREAREKTAKKAQAFFLDEDSARTFGNIDYMRTARRVRRTFPKTAGSPEEMEVIVEVSSIKGSTRVKSLEVETTPTTETNATETNAAQSTAETNEASARRRSDKSMDMFRNMARDIKK